MAAIIMRLGWGYGDEVQSIVGELEESRND